jgi:hypothetical protein
MVMAMLLPPLDQLAVLVSVQASQPSRLAAAKPFRKYALARVADRQIVVALRLRLARRCRFRLSGIMAAFGALADIHQTPRKRRS